MSRWKIYSKDGSVLHESIEKYDGKGRVVEQDTLEYSGKWMGDCFITVSFKSAYPIDFQIGDYIIYRGEKFTINYDPTVVKKSSRGTYGEGFVYDSVKFNSLSSELTDAKFHDWVLSDNKIHYSSLPNFAFYATDVNDLVDRLQACTNRWCKDNSFAQKEYWMFYTPGSKGDTNAYDRTIERIYDVLGLDKDKASTWTADETSLFNSYKAYVLARWKEIYGDTGTNTYRDDERFDRNISVNSQTVWQGMAMIKSEFGLNFITRSTPIEDADGNITGWKREVIVGAAGTFASHTFQYGKGKGLYEVDKQAETDQKVVTRLHAYGSSDNLPARYYAELGITVAGTVKKLYWQANHDITASTGGGYGWSTTYRTQFSVNFNYKPSMFTKPTYYDGTNVTQRSDVYGYVVKVTIADSDECPTLNACVYANNDSEGTGLAVVELRLNYNSEFSHFDWENTSKTDFDKFADLIAVGKKITFVSGVNKDLAPAEALDSSGSFLPDNMAVNNLMLPGFPKKALSELCKSTYDETTDTTSYSITNPDTKNTVVFHTESGKHLVTYSDDAHDPYIVSQYAATLGYKDDDIFCTEENDDNGLEKVYPSVYEVTEAEAGVSDSTDYINEIVSAETIKDNGVFSKKTGTNVPGFQMTIKNLGFDLHDAISAAGGDSCKISMKDGYCGGRDFEVPSVSHNSDGTWTLNCRRSQDSSLDLYYPYSYNVSIGGTATADEAYQVRKGDHFVLTGINIEDTNYIWAASVKLLRKAIHWLCKNDYSRYTYTPKLDEIYMARQDEEAKASNGTTASLHDTLKEGDLLWFKDDDLNLDAKVYIDQLNIKENGNNGIPTYDVTLRNEVQVGTIQRIQNKVDSIANDVSTGNVGGTLSSTNVENIVNAVGEQKFLRKDQDDSTEHKLGMGTAEVTGDMTVGGKAEVKGDTTIGGSADVKGTAALEGGVTIGTEGSYGITKDGLAKLAGVVADYLKSSDFHAGTARGFDGTGFGITKGTDGKYTLETDNIIARMKMIVAELEVHEMTFIGGEVVMSACGNRMDLVEALDGDGNCLASAGEPGKTPAVPEGKTVETYRCYFLATDGDRSVKNEWATGQLARCKTNNLTGAGTYENYENRDYWRLCTGVSKEPVEKSGKMYHWVDLSNSASDQITLTDSSGTQHIVTIGGVSGTLNSEPAAGDNVIGMGHQWDSGRQDVAIVSASGWTLYKGIDHYDLSHDHIVNKFGIDETIVTTDHFTLRPYAQPDDVQTALCVRGEYSATAAYGHNDVVTYGGQSWVCVVATGKTVTGEAPGAGSAYWNVFAAKGETGDGGKSIAMELRTTPFADIYHEGDSYNATLTLVVMEQNTDGTVTDITSSIPATRFRWTRTTARGGDSDTGWNDIHTNIGNVLTLTEKDLDGDTYFLGELLTADGTATMKAVKVNI